MTERVADDVVARAERALADVGREPRAALAEADAVVSAIPRPRTPEEVRAVVTAHRAAGLALRELSELETAEARMRRAVRIADRHALADAGAEARMSLAFTLMERGRPRAASTLATSSLERVHGVLAARLRTIRAMALQRSGHRDEALVDYARALPVLRRSRDTLWESRLLNNRAILLATAGETRRAVADFTRARAIYLADGFMTDAAVVLYNLGYLYGMAGDVPRALDHLDRAAEEWGDLDRPEYWAGRAEVLTRAGLSAEAVVDAQTSLDLLRERGWRTLEAEAWLALAGALLADPEPDLARITTASSAAARLLRSQHRPEWTAMANYVGESARLMSRGQAVRYERVAIVASELAGLGWGRQADSLLVAAALRTGSDARAEQLARQVVDRPGADTGWERRSSVAIARSLVADCAGQAREAELWRSRAWQTAADAQAALGPTDLRAGMSLRMHALVDRGVRRAVDDHSPHRVLTWTERGRSSALRHPPARPRADAALAAAVTRWRWATAAEVELRLAGEDARQAQLAVRAAERDVRRESRRLRSEGNDGSVIAPRLLRQFLGDGVFVQYLVSDGVFWATTTTSTATRLHKLGSAARTRAVARSAWFVLRRLATGFTARESEQLVQELDGHLRALDDLVVAPLLDVRQRPEVVVNPTSAIAPVLWGLLPSLSEAVVAVAPSATVWARARGRGRVASTTRRVAVFAGPGLRAADEEGRLTRAAHHHSQLWTGAAATAEAVTSAATSTDILHIAAHGRLRRDNPLFSSLELADGPLCGYDLQALPRMPELLVLSSCSSGAEASIVGDEVAGLASIALGAGTGCVIASPLPVPDAEALELMAELHRHLAAGLAPSGALHEAQASLGDSPDRRVLAGMFQAYGA